MRLHRKHLVLRRPHNARSRALARPMSVPGRRRNGPGKPEGRHEFAVIKKKGASMHPIC